jgi:hypothetical protein
MKGGLRDFDRVGSCGNCRAMETVEKSKTIFPPFPQRLEKSPLALRLSHSSHSFDCGLINYVSNRATNFLAEVGKNVSLN